MRILVLGNGFVGKPLALYLGADTITDKRLNQISHFDLDPYDVVINTAAKTSIDWCEENKIETIDTNVIDAIRIAQITKGKYVFFSSGCIFKSTNEKEINYEDAIPNPQCFYTYTKLMAEQAIRQIRPDTLIIRPRLLISEHSNPRNTINKLLKYEKIITCQESATVLEDLIIKVKELIDCDKQGTFNIFNEGTISPSEIMTIFKHPHEKITKEQLDILVKGRARRVSTILGTHKTVPLPDIRKRIKDIKKNWLKDIESAIGLGV
jgi:dTDP-4-dehydrorhamnose reductase